MIQIVSLMDGKLAEQDGLLPWLNGCTSSNPTLTQSKTDPDININFKWVDNQHMKKHPFSAHCFIF